MLKNQLQYIKNNPIQTRISPGQKTALVIFGLFLTLLFLETGLRLAGFVFSSLQEHRNRVSISKKGAYRIMCLGESTTSDQYPHFLEEILNQNNRGIKFSVIDKGCAGTTTPYILAQLESNLDEYQPDMVVAMMGINDIGVHLPYEPVSNSTVIHFFKSFRTYKLTKLLWLHILTKAKEIDLYKSKEANRVPKENQYNILAHGLKKAYAQHAGVTKKENALKKSIEINAKDDIAYFELGRLYRDQGRLQQAQECFKKALEINPRRDEAYFELGCLYQNQGKPSQAEEAFKKSIEVNPKNDKAYAQLGWFYQIQGKLSQAEEAYKKTIEVNPKNGRVCFELGILYQGQGKFSQAEETFKKAIELNTLQSDWAAVSVLYKETGRPQLAKEYAKKADTLRSGYYNPVTVNNYHKLREILDKRGIKLACVQYPMRSIEPLKKIFQGNQEGIIFVDNQKIFQDALRRAMYREYFSDAFGGDFGHCTDKGNRLLAGNIASVILKEAFKK